MHSFIDKLLRPLDWLLGKPWPGSLVMPLCRGPLAGFARRRQRGAAKRLLRIAGESPVVTGGIFKGMRYANGEAKCSAILPKLFGTYEAELAGVLARLVSKKYRNCVDIGSAEGYYAIGIARMLPECIVYAVDIDKESLGLCAANAIINQCGSRVICLDGISELDLASFSFVYPSLVLSDCEGFEKELFTRKSVKNLNNCDVIIEAHEFIDPSIPDYLKEVFAASHRLEVIQTISDAQRAVVYEVPRLNGYDLQTKSYLLSEFRPCPMVWYVFTPLL